MENKLALIVYIWISLILLFPFVVLWCVRDPLVLRPRGVWASAVCPWCKTKTTTTTKRLFDTMWCSQILNMAMILLLSSFSSEATVAVCRSASHGAPGTMNDAFISPIKTLQIYRWYVDCRFEMLPLCSHSRSVPELLRNWPIITDLTGNLKSVACAHTYFPLPVCVCVRAHTHVCQHVCKCST